MKKFHVSSILLGIVLLILLIWKIGIDALWQDFLLLNWGLVPFVLMEGVAGIFYTLGWRLCLSPSHQSLPFFRLWSINLAGNSINYFTPTATLGGEVIKETLLSADHRGTEAATGVIIGKLSYALAQLLFVVLGSIFIFWKFRLPAAGSIVMLTGSTLLEAGIVGFLVVQKYGKLGAVVRWLVVHKVGGKVLQKAADQITQVKAATSDRYPSFFAALQGSLAGAPGRETLYNRYIGDDFNHTYAGVVTGIKWNFDFGMSKQSQGG